MEHRKFYYKYLSLHRPQLLDLSKLHQEYDMIVRFWKQSYMSKYLPDNKEAKIIEIGCGLGHHLHALKALGYTNLQGIDVSPEQIKVCKKRIDSVDFQVADAFEFLPGQKEKYDIIIMFDFLEHFTKGEALEICELVFGSLHKRGTVLIRTFNAAHPVNLKVRYDDLTHETGYTVQSLKELLQLSGFAQVEAKGVDPYGGIPSSFRKRWQKNLLLKPFTWTMSVLWRLIYFSQRGTANSVAHLDIFGTAIKT